MTILLIILGAVLFVGLVIVHEWGHFIAARRAGVEVEEFGIGFPPKVWGRKVKTKKSEFLFTINLLPLGGFVRLKGETDDAKGKGTYGSASLWNKTKIMLAGVVMNLVTAYVILLGLALVGMPQILPDQYNVASDSKITREVDSKGKVSVAEVIKDNPAQKAGIEKGDEIILINGNQIDRPEQIAESVKNYAGQAVEIKLKRGGEDIIRTVTLNDKNNGSGLLGISSQSEQTGIETRRSTWSAPIVAGGTIVQFTELTFKGLGSIVTNLAKGDTAKATEQVSGPVGIAMVIKEGSKLGLQFILMIIAVISLSLAIMNVLPIPALDGGRLFVTYLFRIMKWNLTKKREELVATVGFVFLMTMFVLITIVDIKRFF